MYVLRVHVCPSVLGVSVISISLSPVSTLLLPFLCYVLDFFMLSNFRDSFLCPENTPDAVGVCIAKGWGMISSMMLPRYMSA